MAWTERLRRALPALWAGLLIGVAGLATPAAFATLPREQAAQVVAWVLRREAIASLLLGLLLLMLARRRSAQGEAGAPTPLRDADILAALAAIALTVLGYFGLQPMMGPARLGQGPLSFAALHAISTGLFGVKLLLVLALALRRRA